MGSIHKTKSGSYYASAYDVQGNRHRITFNRRAEAEAFINKMEAVKLETRLITAKLKRKRVSFDQALEDFSLTKEHLRPKSIQKYRFVIEQFKLFLDEVGVQYLDEFTPDHGTILYKELIRERPVAGARTEMRKPKPKTVNFFLQTVKALFDSEVVKGHILKSPVVHLKNLKTERRPPEYYTEREIERFFQQQMHKVYRRAFLGLLHTGMRINELVNLTWDDVDFNQKLIFVRNKNGFVSKTDNSDRAIPMNDILFNLLTEAMRDGLSKRYPFCSVKGLKLRDNHLLKVCKRIGESADIKGKVFLHKWRHTFATHLAKKRVPIEAIQQLLGHASIIETMIYTHVKSEQLHNEVSALNNLGNASKQTREQDDIL